MRTLLPLALLLAACGSEPPATPADAAPDQAPDVTVVVDAPADTAPDAVAVADAEPDAAVGDASPSADADAGPVDAAVGDAAADANADASPGDVASDAPSDAPHDAPCPPASDAGLDAMAPVSWPGSQNATVRSDRESTWTVSSVSCALNQPTATASVSASTSTGREVSISATYGDSGGTASITEGGVTRRASSVRFSPGGLYGGPTGMSYYRMGFVLVFSAGCAEAFEVHVRGCSVTLR